LVNFVDLTAFFKHTQSSFNHGSIKPLLYIQITVECLNLMEMLLSRGRFEFLSPSVHSGKIFYFLVPKQSIPFLKKKFQ